MQLLLLLPRLTLSADSIGRIDKSLMSDQTLMELFIAPLKKKHEFQDSSGDFLDISAWPNIEVDSDGKVSKVLFDNLSCPSPKMDFRFLPLSVWLVTFETSNCEGEIEWKALPDNIRFFDGWENYMYGSVDLTSLPIELWVLLLGKNSLSGPLNFSKLPENLEALELSANSFSGTIDIRAIDREIALPDHQRMQAIYDDGEKLPGEWKFGVDLQKNDFEGDVRVKDLEAVHECEPFRDVGKCTRMIDTTGNVRKIA